MPVVGDADVRGNTCFFRIGQGQAVPLQGAQRHANPQMPKQRTTAVTGGDDILIAGEGPLTGLQAADASPALIESPHLTLGQQAKVAAGIELVEQGKAELMTICRFIAWRIDSALQRRTNMFERRLQLQAGFSIQRLLILRINPFCCFIKIIFATMDN